MTKVEAKLKELGMTMNEIYDFIRDNDEARKNCNELLLSGMDFYEACVLTYVDWN